MKKIFSLFLAVFVLLSLSGATVSEASVKPKLSEHSVSIEKGTTYKLTVLNTDEEIIWSTSDKSIAKVSSKGRITAKKAGKCKIYATIGTKKLTCHVNVYNNYSAESDAYGVSGFSTLMGRLPLKKFKYKEDAAHIKELTSLGNKCQVFFGLNAKSVDIVLDSDNYVYFIKNVKKYADKYPDNAYLNSLALIADAAYETEAVTDRDGTECYVIIQRESELAALDAAADNKDSDDEGFFFIFYPNRRATDFDCIVIGCDAGSFDHITWYKIK